MHVYTSVVVSEGEKTRQEVECKGAGRNLQCPKDLEIILAALRGQVTTT